MPYLYQTLIKVFFNKLSTKMDSSGNFILVSWLLADCKGSFQPGGKSSRSISRFLLFPGRSRNTAYPLRPRWTLAH